MPVLALLVAAPALLTGCSSEADRPSADASTGSTAGPSAEQCGQVLSDDALEALGWRAEESATAAAGRCERRAGTSGTFTTGVLPAPGADEGATRDAYAEECATLASADGDIQPEVDWLDVDGSACARLPVPGEDTGVAEVVVLTGDERLIQVRLAVLEPTDRPRLQDGINRVVVAAADQL